VGRTKEGPVSEGGEHPERNTLWEESRASRETWEDRQGRKKTVHQAGVYKYGDPSKGEGNQSKGRDYKSTETNVVGVGLGGKGPPKKEGGTPDVFRKNVCLLRCRSCFQRKVDEPQNNSSGGSNKC